MLKMFIKKNRLLLLKLVSITMEIWIAKLHSGAKAGSDAIKFQSFITENLTKKNAQKYHIKLTKKNF